MSTPHRSPITTHILDLETGTPASRVPVTLEVQEGTSFKLLAQGQTNEDGRIEDLLPRGSKAPVATYRMTFDTRAYYQGRGSATFYPYVTIVFDLTNPERHHHVPLLVNAYGYSTYRGS